MTDQIRYDKGEVKGAASRTDEGYVRAEAIVTRTGVFDYRNADGSVRRELRHPDQVFERASLDTMKMIPIVNGHPAQQLVNASNSKDLAIGHTGETITVDGRYVLAPLVVTSADGVEAIDGGRRELSLGYTVELVREDGEYGGQRYTHRQTRIRYNHLALVDRARAGAAARINLDGESAAQIDEEESRSMGEKTLKTVTLDGIDYEAAPEVANALAKAQARADEAEEKLKTVEPERDQLKAKLDAATEELETLKKADHSEAVAKAVAARIGLERAAAKVLPADTKLDGKTDREVMEAVILAKSPKANLDGQTDVYVQARFDAVIEGLPDGKAIGEQRKAAAEKVTGEVKADAAEEARQKAQDEMANMWKKRDKKEAA
ncbi:DUF2213 domain-containing protein [Marinibaculum pumilum]|uniref:DUF2213 domain-containing protein n=1 Tax=Marinibaculum pumilum TaxID=1766165 RepID=A0ABV7KYV2_9PROT